MLEKMRIEMEVKGHDVYFAIVNAVNASTDQSKLIDKCAMPLFQDTTEADAWGLHKGKKDDFFIYGVDGKLAQYLPVSGEIDVNLSTDIGYYNLKNAIFEELGVPTETPPDPPE
ncbi:MAG TPA: hypothetical protein EYN06_04705 [Myxococcales bacterium]|nr:hypothetical protein [Myxococcales bacterium]HIN85762.1 hypothetical protein [Myxococcales bacterium]